MHSSEAKETGRCKFIPFLELIEQKATDDRKMVKKAINWALRQIGKRNLTLNENALKTTEKMLESKNKAALWIARMLTESLQAMR